MLQPNVPPRLSTSSPDGTDIVATGTDSIELLRARDLSAGVWRDNSVLSQRFRASFLTNGYSADSIPLSNNVHLFSKISEISLLCAITQSPLFHHMPGLVHNFFDLGCGNARPALAVASLGWRSFGVELYGPCVDEARANIEKAEKVGFIPPGSVKVAHGDFFLSPSFKDTEKDNAPVEPHLHYLARLASTTPATDFEQELGIRLNEIDLFFHFQVERINKVLRFFAQVAKPGAVLFFVSTFSEPPPTVPAEISLVAGLDHNDIEKDSRLIFQKVR